MGDNTPATTIANPFAGNSPDLSGGGGGLTFGQQAVLDALQSFNDIRLRATPTTSFSSSTNQTLLDPRSLELQALQLSQQHFIDLQNLDLARDKQRLAEEQGKADIALQNAALAEQIQSRIQNREIQMAQMRQQAEQFRQTMEFQQDSERFNRSLKIMELTESARQFNAQQRRQVAMDIATLASSPGDVVKSAALQQQSGRTSGSPISSAISSGQSAITDESLAPLQELLSLSDSLNAPEARRGVFSGGFDSPTGDQFGFGGLPTGSAEEAAARKGAFDANLNTILGQVLQGNPNGPLAGSPIANALTDIAATTGSAIVNNGGVFSAAPGTPGSKQGFQGAMAEHGGVFTGPVVTGDSSSGKENQEAVFSASPILVVPIKNDSMPARKAETGGVFTGTDTTRARQFLADALAKLFQRFREQGLNIGNQPTPIGVSAPGTNPAIQQIAAATSAAQTGFDPQSFLGEAQGLAPTGIRQSIFSRI